MGTENRNGARGGASRTTPPRPADIAAVFPGWRRWPARRPGCTRGPGRRPGRTAPSGATALAGRRAVAALRLPASGIAPAAADFAGEVRLQREVRAGARGRPPGDTGWPLRMVPATAGAGAGRPPAGPVAMLALAQLYVRDVPALRPPGRADLLQVLWCPFDHRPTGLPRTALFWRSVTAVAEILTAPPEPAAVQYDDYVPEPCLLAPEQVTEYPVAAELEPDLRAEVRAWSARQAVAAAPGSTGAGGGDDAYYDRELAVSPGWKVGGLPSWSATDPRPLHCCACGSRMQPMLTVASYEWQPNGPGWIPYEDRAAAAAPTGYPAPATPTMIGLAGGCNQQIYACPASPDHPHAELLQ
ncbi:hypothetical protein GCM10025734_22570 [Kitasatospora paranensis]